MKKVVCLVPVLALMVASVAPAQAATRNIDSTIKIAHVEETGSPPISGAAEYAGTFKGALGSGAIVGGLSYTVPNFQGTLRVYLNKGTLKGTMEGSGAPAPGGGVDVSGTGAITKGTGKYKGAHGEFTFSGNQAADPSVATLAITGSVKY
jgi:hypothetical protein